MLAVFTYANELGFQPGLNLSQLDFKNKHSGPLP